jgi:hypothetical protein
MMIPTSAVFAMGAYFIMKIAKGQRKGRDAAEADKIAG